MVWVWVRVRDREFEITEILDEIVYTWYQYFEFILPDLEYCNFEIIENKELSSFFHFQKFEFAVCF